MSWLDEATGLESLDDEARRLLAPLRPVDLAAGKALFHPGDTVRGFVVVLSGRVDVFLSGPTGRDILLYSVEPGQSCVQSTLGLIGGDDYSGEALTFSACRLVLVPRDTFLALMNRSDDFRRYVFAAFAERMQSMMHLLEKVAFQRVEARLAEMLLARATGNRLQATQAEIAALIGSAREVVSRRLDALARRGIVRLERGVVHIEDPQALREIAGRPE